jgi:outer membrane protein
MRHRLARFCGVLCAFGLLWSGSSAAAQTAPTVPPPAAAPPAPTPGRTAAVPAQSAAAPTAPASAPAVPPSGAAPADQAALQPAAAAVAPQAPVNPEGFNLTEALRGTGPAMSSAEAAKRAAQTAPGVAKAEAAAKKAEAAADQANVALYPRLELEARYTRLSHVTPPPALRGIIKVMEDQGLFQARLSYPVSSLFFSIIPRHKAALKAAEAQKLQSRVESQTVGLRTREAYYNYARARAARMVASAALAQAEAHRRDSDALVNAGSIARVELMRADAQVAAAKVALTRADFSVTSGRSAFYTLVHVDGSDDITVGENLEEELAVPDEDENALLTRALERRSEIKALRILAEAHEHTIDALQGQQLPNVVIGGTAEYADPNQRVFGAYKEWDATWAAYAALVWSPNDTGSAGAQIDQSRADLAQTLADLQSLQDALRVEVSQAYNGYASAHAALEASRVGIAAAEESYRVRREQFRAGAAIAVDVLDAEAQLRQARLDLVNALIDTRIARARIDRAAETD